jgi:predicted ATPase/class 3 adenylate cyclase/Tfp pilus assembly protein PilF
LAELPSGTVTFLCTDIEGSTALWERDPLAMRRAVERHLGLLDTAVTEHGGVHFKTVGDAIQAAFATMAAALAAAVAAQRALTAEPWPETGPLRVRMAIHVGEATPRDGDYLAPALTRLARLLSAGHGGQILLSAAAEALARDTLPPDVSLLDLGPHRLRDLLEPERIFQLVHPALPAAFPPLKSLDARPNNLPNQPNPFIGREGELAEIVAQLRESRARLLTLTGPGGTGKTRLALQAAAELLETFPDGVFFIPLAALTDAALVPATIAAALHIRESAEQAPREQLLVTLAGKEMLLVLDNLEQIPGAALFIAELLGATPKVHVLATSRAPLHVRGEREFPVSPLPLPPADPSLSVEDLSRFDAVQVFVARARAIKPDFALDARNAGSVGAIVRRLDGLPLAIELAAARIRLFPPQAMLARLETRLPLLTGGARDLPARQRALRETIAWSHELLAPDEQALFRGLAVFAGGFTLDAAEFVEGERGGMRGDEGGAGDRSDPPAPPSALDLVSALVAQSMLTSQDHADGSVRFGMLETIREYGLERLADVGELEAVRGRHAQFFLALAEGASTELEGAQSAVWLDRLEAEHDNLRAALAWALDRPADATAMRLAAALWPFWDIRGHYAEGRDWLERVLARDVAEPTTALAEVLTGTGSIARMQSDARGATAHLGRALELWTDLNDQRGVARVLLFLGHVADRQGDLTGARTHFEDALRIGRDTENAPLTGSTLINLGIIADQQGDPARAIAQYEEALAIFRRLGDRRLESIALDNLGIVARSRGDLAEATRLFEDAIAVSRAVGDAWGVAGTLGNLGGVALQRGDVAQARASYEESLAGFRALGDRRGVANTVDNLGVVARQAGELPRAAALHAEGLELVRELGDHIGVVFGLEGLAAVADSAGKTESMMRLYAAADALRAALGAPRPAENQPEYEQVLATARVQLGQDRFTAVWQGGSALTLEEAIAEGLALARDLVAARASA